MTDIAKTTTGAETSIAVYKDSNGNLQIGDTYTKTGNVGGVLDPPAGYSAYIDGHNHEYVFAPSAGDLWSVMESIAKFETFETRYIFAKDGSVFALTVNDRQAAIDFLASHPKENYIAKDANGSYTGEFNKTTDLYTEFDKALYKFWANGFGDKANEAAKAYILDKFNMGISLSKKEANQAALKTINSTSDENGNYSSSQCN